MTAKLLTVDRTDSVDRGEFQRMIESELFGSIQARIYAEMKRNQDACQSSDSGLKVRRAQGAVAALRAALELPAQMLAEMTKPR